MKKTDKPDKPDKPVKEYKMLEGALGRKYVKGSGKGLVFRSDADKEKFKELVVDGDVVAGKYYKVTSGSTIVELFPEYLDLLEPGIYTLKIVSTDGYAAAEFEIAAAKDKPEAVETGDKSTALPYALAMAAAVAAALICGLILRKRD